MIKNFAILFSLFKKKSILLLILLISLVILEYSSIISILTLYSNMINALVDPWFNILLLLSTFYIYYSFMNYFEVYTMSKIRYSNIKKYLKTIVIDSFIISTFFILLCFIIIYIVCLFKTNFNIENILFINQINSLTYLIFLEIKIILLLNIMSIIGILIYKIFNLKIAIIYIVITALSLFGYPYSDNSVVSILDFKLYYGYYLTLVKYSNFIFEIFMFCLYLSFLFLVIDINYRIYLKFKE